MNRDLVEVFIFALLGLGLILVLIITGGCLPGLGSTPSAKNGPNSPDLLPTLPRVPSWGFVGTGLVVGFVLSIVAVGLGFAKLGGVTAIACVAGLLLQSALAVPWLSTAAAIMVLGSVVLVGAGILHKNKAIQEIVTGIQEYKTDVLANNEDRNSVNETLQAKQSTSTQQLVKAVKNKLKLTGGIK